MTDHLAPDLSSLELFASADPVGLAHLTEHLVLRHCLPGEVLIREGDPGGAFLIVLHGSLVVERGQGGDRRELATVGPGSVLGELSMLTGRSRQADVTALTEAEVALGDHQAFELLLEVPGVHDAVATMTARRFAELARPVPATLPDGTAVVLRPLLAADRQGFARIVAGLSPETLRRRFFTAGRPSERVIDHLVNINYVDHFAWRVGLAADDRGVATARYVRLRDDAVTAEVAFGVVDDFQGRGLGTLLLGALAVAASSAGISRFVADVLTDNLPMRAVFDKAGATWGRVEPGVAKALMEVSVVEQLLDEPLREALRAASRDIVTGAGLALAHVDRP